ncbi:stage II sporulation protein M [Nonlabens ponticola]|uniref:Stage II sporulation protein M n=1 Tax=Nonlabens ponticola TaxID=2496866 RepID=A0A3S9MXH5_9FLAO|nr:stage II sporulation protein M [Nonlabens ponticola]AZQ43976.1 stage II sporulation protein M [Nonlabens ponticola]
MREAAFVKQNKEKWIAFERALDANSNIAADRLADLYIQLTNDLSFAQTYYQESKTLLYLNSLASQAHQKIYKNKKESGNKIWDFFSYEFPLFFADHLKTLGFAFLIFMVAVAIGTISTLNDDSFSRLILGDSYVNMTLENIRDGNPTGVYQQDGAFGMFIAITVNNIKVGMFCFALGILTSIGTSYILFSNGIMVGTFFSLFALENVSLESWSVIMLHGTIELSVIVVCGAAGMIMGNSLLFPKTYSRITSFTRGAKNGLKVMMSTVPLFIIAGFIEGFVTRYAFMPSIIKYAILLVSAAIILGYYVLYPLYLKKKHATIHRTTA